MRVFCRRRVVRWSTRFFCTVAGATYVRACVRHSGLRAFYPCIFVRQLADLGCKYPGITYGL
jgi:hypothetical protein